MLSKPQQIKPHLRCLLVKNLPANAGRRKWRGFHPWVGKIPWRRAQQLTPAFLPGESHEQRSLVGYRPQGHKESDMTGWAHTHIVDSVIHTYIYTRSIYSFSYSFPLWFVTGYWIQFTVLYNEIKVAQSRPTIQSTEFSRPEYWSG